MKATSYYSQSRDSWFVRVDFGNGDNTDLECESESHASQIEDAINDSETAQLQDTVENLREQLAKAEEKQQPQESWAEWGGLEVAE